MAIILLWAQLTYANRYLIPFFGDRLIGQEQTHIVNEGEHFQLLARRYGVGLLALMLANSNVDPFLPAPSVKLVIPTQMLLPKVARKGIVINLAELRLYYYPPEGTWVYVFPIGVGRLGKETPEMTTVVARKHKDPVWRPTASIRREHFERTGYELAKEISPGPNNPLGKYALRLSYGAGVYLIHGTNKNFGIGLRVSSGCIRLNPEDIEFLYHEVEEGELIRIINEPVKFSSEANGEFLLEIHKPLSKLGAVVQQIDITPDVLRLISDENVKQSLVQFMLQQQSGLPGVVGRK